MPGVMNLAPGDGATATPSKGRFPIVGVGASAGGLKAFTQLLRCLPADTGMAFVLIQHLDPAHPSLLSAALAKATAMPVREAEDGTLVERDHVYAIPAGADLTIREGRLSLVARPQEGRGTPHLPVDFFLRALAEERGSHAIGVVLSGTASDGTEGLRAIKGADGITIAQDPSSAKFSGMPRSALDAGVVDHCLSPPAIAEELVRLSRHSYLAVPPPAPRARDDRAFKEILAVVRSLAGVDFSEYKAPTLERRLARRMALRRVEDLQAYLAVLQADPEEAQALHEDILIHVTSFFRDPDVFEVLAARIFPEILRGKREDAPLRMWVAGCSTGEEVYSLAIALREQLGESSRPVQIFGSDASRLAIETARAGVYDDGALRDLGDERRRRYFTRVEHGHRIIKSVRDLCVFVEHDLARDPPFSKLDLVSCRNVLIYFDRPLQERVLSRLHYALNQPGYLLLGRSENISMLGQLFTAVDRTHKLFARSSAPSTLRLARAVALRPVDRRPRARQLAERSRHPGVSEQQLDRLLLARDAPSGVLGETLPIPQSRGLTGAVLHPAPGAPPSDLATLRAAIARAKQERAPVRTKGVVVDQEGATRSCDLVVIPLAGLSEVEEELFAVLLEDSPAARPSLARAGRREDHALVAGLEHELAATKEYLYALIDEQGRSNDELGLANEELISGNEELQSLNEELETAKEELQSTNEELITVNDELQSRNLELAQVNSDLVNLLATIEIPILIVDRERRIRRYTPSARRILSVLPSDVGRPLADIRLHIDVGDLDQQIATVIETMAVKDAEVRDRAGHWYRLQIRPYRTIDGRIDGATVSFVDIDTLKHLVGAAQDARAGAERANLAKDQFLATLSHELRSPLASMLVHAQLLRSGALDDSKVRRAGEAVERGTKVLVQLIDDLLDVSRIVAGKLKLNPRPVDLGVVVDDALAAASARAERKGITIAKVAPTESIGRVQGDRTRLQQIVTNLLTNAIKFSPAGGRVTLTLERSGASARLVVSDTGVGIEPGFLPRVFDPFAQEDSSSTRTYDGLGLGLAIVRHLVELHGGTVRAESPGKGEGAVLSVTLPLLRVEAGLPSTPWQLPADDPRLALDDERLRDLRILIVEDDAPTRDAIAEMLHQRGAWVALAGSADEAMAAVEAGRPDVVVCDIAMPGEDGYGFVRRLRALGAARGGETPAVALTALAGEDDRQQALQAGFQLHLAKPVDIDRLVEALASLRGRDPGPRPA